MIDEQTVQKLIDRIIALEEKVAFLSRMESNFVYNPVTLTATLPATIKINGASGDTTTYKTIGFDSDGISSWFIRVRPDSIGLDPKFLEIVRRDSSGNFVDTPFAIDWSTGLTTILQEAWVAPTLLNSWVNYGGGYNSAGYFKDSHDVVHLRGMIKDGTATSGTTLFTLPVGYRPTARELFNVQSNGALGRIDVLSTGSVQILTGSNVWISLDGISFKAV